MKSPVRSALTDSDQNSDALLTRPSSTYKSGKAVQTTGATSPVIGHLKSDNRMDRCWLPGQLGDALHAVLCAEGYNLRWLLRAMARLGLKALLLRPTFMALLAALLRANPFQQVHPAAGLSLGLRLGALGEFCRGDFVVIE